MSKKSSELTNTRLTLIGCGRMGSALLKGWLRNGLSPQNVKVLDPNPSDWLISLCEKGVQINPTQFGKPDIVVLATKPQYVAAAIASIATQATPETIFISIAAGVTISQLEHMLERPVSVVRAMPNTPAEVGHGVTGIVANNLNTDHALERTRELMQAVGQVIIVEDEDMMHAVTAMSGSGPAYVFAMAEAMEHSGVNLGLPQDIARTLAVETIKGAGCLMSVSKHHASDLREAVTSPGGTTAAGLERLLATETGLNELVWQTVSAAAARSRALENNNSPNLEPSR